MCARFFLWFGIVIFLVCAGLLRQLEAPPLLLSVLQLLLLTLQSTVRFSVRAIFDLCLTQCNRHTKRGQFGSQRCFFSGQ